MIIFGLIFLIYKLSLILFFPDSSTSLPYYLDNKAIIYITNGGFSEKDITIPVGGTVTWINTTAKAHWPASDFHPTHSIYPESGIENCGTKKEKVIFDACKGIMEGEEYSFTFTRVGSWNYHDHLFPSLVGTVDVVLTEDDINNDGKDTSLSPIPTPEEFRALNGNEQSEILNAISKDNPKAGWEYLKQSFILNGEIMEEGHSLSHIAGANIYEKRGFKGIEICDPTFSYGCYHGVTEQFLINKGPEKIRDAMDICRSIFNSEPKKNKTKKYQTEGKPSNKNSS